MSCVVWSSQCISGWKHSVTLMKLWVSFAVTQSHQYVTYRISSIVSQSAQKPCDCHGLGFCVFLLSLTASSMSFPSVFPFVTSPVLFPPHSPHLFLIPLLVSVYLVFVLPALLVSSLCDVPVFPMSPLRNATADHSFQLLSDCSCTTYTSTSTIFCNYPVQ